MTTRFQTGIVLSAALLLPLAGGCAKSGSSSSVAGGGVTGGSSSVGSSTSTGASSAGQAPAQAHWQTALAAFGQANPPAQPLTVTQPSCDAVNAVIARSWPTLRSSLIDPMLAQQIRAQIATLGSSGAVTIATVKSLTIDTAAPPRLSGADRGTFQDLGFELPRSPSAWRAELNVDVGWATTVHVLGVPISMRYVIDATIEVKDIRLSQVGTLDVSNPSRPRLAAQPPSPVVQLAISIRSQNPLISQIVTPLTQILDPILRVALAGGGIYAQQQIGPLLAQVPWTPWGTGAQPTAGAPLQKPLEEHAVEVADEIRRTHMPYDTVMPAKFDQSVFGQGNVVDYFDHGDSIGWTLHFVMGETMRYALTGDPRALEGVEKGLRGLESCLDVSLPADGLLARCAVPLSEPYAQRHLVNERNAYTGTVRGQACIGTGDMSRDHYVESLMGLSQVWLYLPQKRAQVQTLVGRMLGYLLRNEWCVFKSPTSSELSVAMTWAQSPAGVWAFLRVGALTDPARFQAEHDATQEIAGMLWLTAWSSGLEVHEQYFKFNLAHDEVVTLAATETDPARYRHYGKVMGVLRDAIGHHDNAYYDAIYGACAPGAAATMGTRVQNALERWTLRPRRCFAVALTSDPTIAKTLYNSPLKLGGPELVANQPIPIEKRPPNDFLWQRSPFELASFGQGPDMQYPGIDLTQPYWLARMYGLVR